MQRSKCLLKGAVLIIVLIVGALALVPIALGFAIVSLVLFAKDSIRSFMDRPRPYAPTQYDLAGMAESIERQNRLADERRAKEFDKRREAHVRQRRIELESRLAGEKKQIETKEVKPQIEFIDIYKGFFYAKDLTDDQINMCKNNGYAELNINPFGAGKGPRVLIKPPDNQSLVHYYFCMILQKEAEKYGKEATIYPSVHPDVVIFDTGGIAFEVETGSHYKKKDLKEKFRRVKEDFSVYYILVTKWELKEKYKQYGNVITRSEIKETMAGLFNNSALNSDQK